MTIDSLSNTQVKYWVSLHQAKHRQEFGQFLVEGEHLVQEAISVDGVDLILLSVGMDNPYPTIKSVVLSDKVFKKVSRLESQGTIMAVCHLNKTENQAYQRIILCDRIQDPGNLGTIIRTATAFGFDQIICSKDCVDFTNEKVIRSTQGALFHLQLDSLDLVSTIQSLKKKGVIIYGTSLEEAESLSSIHPVFPMGLVLGNEGAGVSKEVLELCNQKIKIESSSFESLNVAIAAGILCHHFRK